jgi:hypothetical protein
MSNSDEYHAGFRIPIDFGVIDYDRDAAERLLTELVAQRAEAIEATQTDDPPDYKRVFILVHTVGVMRYVLDNLWPKEEHEPRPSPAPRLVQGYVSATTTDDHWSEPPGGEPLP